MHCLIILLAALAIDPISLTGRMDYALPITAPRVCIVGSGYNGTDVTGPMLVFNGASGGIRCGSADPFRATGARIDSVRVVRVGTGGCAVSFVARSAAERPGEIVIRDVLVCGLSDLQGGSVKDNWETGLLIDGGDLNDTNAAGVRRVRLDGVRVASCLGDSIVLRNVTHLTATHLQIDKGTANRVPTMIVENSRHLDLAVNIFGELHLRGCDVVNVRGYVQTLRVDAKCRNVTINGVVGKYEPERGGGFVNTWGMVIQRVQK